MSTEKAQLYKDTLNVSDRNCNCLPRLDGPVLGERLAKHGVAFIQVVNGFCAKADGKDKLTALIQVRCFGS
jgi:hypothetical protein